MIWTLLCTTKEFRGSDLLPEINESRRWAFKWGKKSRSVGGTDATKNNKQVTASASPLNSTALQQTRSGRVWANFLLLLIVRTYVLPASQPQAALAL